MGLHQLRTGQQKPGDTLCPLERRVWQWLREHGPALTVTVAAGLGIRTMSAMNALTGMKVKGYVVPVSFVRQAYRWKAVRK